MAIRLSDLTKTWLEAQSIRRNNPEKFHGMMPEIQSIAKAIGKVRFPAYGVIISYQKAGKTASLLTLNEMYAKQGYTTLFISNEIGPYDMGTRLMANISMTDMERMEDHLTDEEEDLRIDAAIARLEQQNSWFVYKKYTPEDILKEIKDVQKKTLEASGNNEIRMAVFIDYFNLLRIPGKYRSKPEMEESLSHWLQSLTLPPQDDELTAEKMLGIGTNLVTVWTASQVPKSVKRGGDKLTADSAKGSTALEDDASYIGVMNYVHGKDKEILPNIREITWTSRFGPGGVSIVHFNGAQARMEDVNKTEQEDSVF